MTSIYLLSPDIFECISRDADKRAEKSLRKSEEKEKEKEKEKENKSNKSEASFNSGRQSSSLQNSTYLNSISVNLLHNKNNAFKLERRWVSATTL